MYKQRDKYFYNIYIFPFERVQKAKSGEDFQVEKGRADTVEPRISNFHYLELFRDGEIQVYVFLHSPFFISPTFFCVSVGLFNSVIFLRGWS